MVQSQDATPAGGKRGLYALVAAWVLLFAVIASGLVWVFYLHPDAQTAEQDAEEPGLESPAEPPAPTPEAEGTAETATVAKAPSEPPSKAEASAEELSAKLQRPAAETAPAWRRFAAAFDGRDQRPRIAVVVTGLGLNAKTTETAVRKLPPEITLSFTPYAEDLSRWITLARVEGHEVMLDLPMEPADFPRSDPGPLALMTEIDDRENLRRLDQVLGRGSSYIGVAAMLGSRFSASAPDMRILLRALKTKGLLYLDNGSSKESVSDTLAASLGAVSLSSDRRIDDSQSSAAVIRARLTQVEQLARTRGQAVAMASPYPLSIEELLAWAQALEQRGFTLAPVSALAPQPGPA